jgi:predicted ferric reductase
MTDVDPESELADTPPILPLRSLVILLLAVASGAFAAIAIQPYLLPGLSASLTGPEPKVFWYLSRSSAGIAFLLIWFSMVLGLLITNKLACLWPGGPIAFELHQLMSLLGLAFALFHALILMGDAYFKANLVDLLVPFATDTYRPLWVGLGQIGFYLTGIVTVSFYVRRRITPKVWRSLHYLSFLAFGTVLLHGIFSGTDTSNPWIHMLYLFCGVSLLFLLILRLLTSFFKSNPRRKRLAA